MEHPIRSYRLKHELTQGQLADLLGISDALVTHIENGRRRITPENAIEWESKTGIPRSVLLPEIFAVPLPTEPPRPAVGDSGRQEIKEAA